MDLFLILYEFSFSTPNFSLVIGIHTKNNTVNMHAFTPNGEKNINMETLTGERGKSDKTWVKSCMSRDIGQANLY